MTTKLTDKQKFDFEMIYKEDFVKRFTDRDLRKRPITDQIKVFSLELFSIYHDDKDSIMAFLNDYQDIVSWYKVIVNNRDYIGNSSMLENTFIEIVDLYSEKYFNNDKIWVVLSNSSLIYNIDFLRKYKDKLNWHTISKYHNKIDLDFILEFKSYIKFNVLYASNPNCMEIKNKLLDLMVKNLDMLLEKGNYEVRR